MTGREATHAGHDGTHDEGGGGVVVATEDVCFMCVCVWRFFLEGGKQVDRFEMRPLGVCRQPLCKELDECFQSKLSCVNDGDDDDVIVCVV